jgi:hypothetical protein
MKIKTLSISQILGIQHLDIKLGGKITKITGENASGKTSIIEALKAGLQGGHDATLLRDGAEEGETVILLDDGIEIRKSITASESDMQVTHPEVGRITKTATYLKRILNALSLNPLQFMYAKKDDRLNQFLEAIPITITRDQLPFVNSTFINSIDFNKHGLQVISNLYKLIFEARTNIKRDEKTKRATAEQTRKTLPPDAPDGDWQAILDAAIAGRDELQASTQASIDALEATTTLAINEAKAKYDAFKDQANAEKQLEEAMRQKYLDIAIEKLRTDHRIANEKLAADTDIAISNALVVRDASTTALEIESKRQQHEAIESGRPRYEELTEVIANAGNLIELHANSASTKAFAMQMEAEAEECLTKAKNYTHMLDKLDEFRVSLLKDLPIKGLEVKDGDIYVGNVPFDRVNESKRMILSIEIAAMKAGSLKLIAVDGMERLDSKNFKAWEKAIAATDLQCIMSRVSDDPLTIENVD